MTDPAGSPAAPPVPSRHSSWLVRRLRGLGWADSQELTHTIHGTVVGAAAMAAASIHGTLGEVVITVLVTVVVYWAAEQYARVLAVAVKGTERLEKIAVVLRHGLPMIQAAYVPLVVLIVVTLVAGNLQFGVFVALGVATLQLGGLGRVAARRAGTSRAAAFGWAAVSAGMGVVVILLKLSLH